MQLQKLVIIILLINDFNEGLSRSVKPLQDNSETISVVASDNYTGNYNHIEIY